MPARKPRQPTDTTAALSVRSEPPQPPAARRPVVTMRDIAAAAAVSQSTVSRVLNNVPTRVPIAQ